VWASAKIAGKSASPGTENTSATAPQRCLLPLNVLDGTVIGRNLQRHRHQEFIRFLNAIEAEAPAAKPCM
jgi:hypothetical protein